MIGGLEYDATIKGLEFQQRGRWLQIEYKGNTQVRPLKHQDARPHCSQAGTSSQVQPTRRQATIYIDEHQTA